MFRHLVFWSVSLAVAVTQSVTACPGCKDPASVTTVALDAGQRSVALVNAGFSWSVLFLLAVPALLVGGIGAFTVKTCRRLDKTS
jgi:hypothetical protein